MPTQPSPAFPLTSTDLNTTIGRLKAIADEANTALLTEGPVHPDRELLDLCAEALHDRRLFDDALAIRLKNDQQRHDDCKRRPYGWTDDDREAHDSELATERTFDAAMRRVLFKAKKLKASTPAGIYAKALIVRSSRSGSAMLAMSLADDLILCPGLRESLWPAREES